jgi:hypothetical protein
MHLRETFGERTPGDSERMRTHYAEADNELHHLLIMEELGGNSSVVDRTVAQTMAFFYYWYVSAVYAFSEQAACTRAPASNARSGRPPTRAAAAVVTLAMAARARACPPPSRTLAPTTCASRPAPSPTSCSARPLSLSAPRAQTTSAS